MRRSTQYRNHSRSAAELDRRFDQLIPAELRYLSLTHWTPVDVAVRAARLLDPTASQRVLDVGSGIGKLCMIGALSTPGTWVGVEQHGRLVDTATVLAQGLGISQRTHFVLGDALALDWNEFDALYFYNPFELPVFASAPQTTSMGCVQERLAVLREGTRVATLHGFGGEMPPTFELAHYEWISTVGFGLALWIQRTSERSTGKVSSS